MKKRMFIVGVAVIALLVLSSFVSILNVQAQGLELKPTKDVTPGAKATEMAIQHATQGIGKGHQKMNYKGVIAAVDSTSLTLTLKDGSTVVFVITPDTIVRIPTLGQNATVADLYVGAQAHVRASFDGTNLNALVINTIPGKPLSIHRVGTVTEYLPGVSITIQDKDGNLFTFLVNTDTKILPEDLAAGLKAGSVVTIISPRDVAGGQLIAAGIVIHGSGGTPEASESPEPSESPTP